MSTKKQKTPVGRRDFFRKAGLGVGAVGAASIGFAADKTSAAEPSSTSTQGGGYRETEHVKKYYELSRF